MEDDTVHQLDSADLDNRDSETTDLDESEQQMMMPKIREEDTNEELMKAFQTLDYDNDVSSIREEDTNEELMKAFQTLDYDNDGKISAGDIKRISEELGESLTDAEIQEIIKAADLDSDGEISFDEFIRMTSGTMLNGY